MHKGCEGITARQLTTYILKTLDTAVIESNCQINESSLPHH